MTRTKYVVGTLVLSSALMAGCIPDSGDPAREHALASYQDRSNQYALARDAISHS
jgi:outer membrane murein-binding lipoprotein Lpp